MCSHLAYETLRMPLSTHSTHEAVHYSVTTGSASRCEHLVVILCTVSLTLVLVETVLSK